MLHEGFWPSSSPTIVGRVAGHSHDLAQGYVGTMNAVAIHRLCSAA